MSRAVQIGESRQIEENSQIRESRQIEESKQTEEIGYIAVTVWFSPIKLSLLIVQTDETCTGLNCDELPDRNRLVFEFGL